MLQIRRQAEELTLPIEPMNAKDTDISNALAIIIQALVVQLMDAKVLTVAQGQHVFDTAVKKARQASPEIAKIVQLVHDVLPWDKLYEVSARARKKPK
jgi:hypothetical protein